MKIKAPFALAALTTLVTLPLPAECGCANAPCEQTTLQSSIAREDLAGEFGASLRPVEATVASGSMPLEFSSTTGGGGTGLVAAFLVAIFLFPFALAFGRLVAYSDRLVLLRIGTVDSTARRVRQVPASGWTAAPAARGAYAPLLGAGARLLGADAPS
jgi:hypothetical protein